MRRTMIIATLFALVLAFGACGGGEDAFTEANLSKQLVDANLLEKDVADCVAASVFTELSDEQIKDMGKADVSGGELPPELQAALTTAIQTCVTAAPGDGTGGDGSTEGS